MALPLLPPSHIVPAFRQLRQQQQQKQQHAAIDDLCRYVETCTWLINAMLSPATLSVYEENVRTSNDLEGAMAPSTEQRRSPCLGDLSCLGTR